MTNEDLSAKAAWEEVGNRMVALGLKLKLHAQQAQAEEGEQVKDALDKFGDALKGVVDAVGSAAKDPSVKDDVRDAGSSLADALANTFHEVGAGIRNAIPKR